MWAQEIDVQLWQSHTDPQETRNTEMWFHKHSSVAHSRGQTFSCSPPTNPVSSHSIISNRSIFSSSYVSLYTITARATSHLFLTTSNSSPLSSSKSPSTL